MIKASADGGNNSIKVVVDGQDAIVYDNIYSLNYHEIDYDMQPNAKKSRFLGCDVLDVTIETNTDSKESITENLLFGDFAKRQSVNSEITLRETKELKSEDDALTRNILISLAATYVSNKIKNEESLTANENIDVILSTGLPYKEFSIKKCRDTMKSRLIGKHTIKFNHPYFKQLGLQDVTLNVKDVIVKIEGDAAIDSMTLSGDCSLVENYKENLLALNKQKVFGIDVGRGTSEIIGKQFNYYDSEEGLSYDILGKMCKGISKGIGDIIYETYIEAKNKYGNLDLNDVEYAFKPSNIHFGIIEGTTIDLTETFNVMLIKFAQEIVIIFSGLFSSEADRLSVRRVYLAGGGSSFSLLKETIENGLKIKGFSNLDVVVTENPDPILANVYGYYFALD